MLPGTLTRYKSAICYRLFYIEVEMLSCQLLHKIQKMVKLLNSEKCSIIRNFRQPLQRVRIWRHFLHVQQVSEVVFCLVLTNASFAAPHGYSRISSTNIIKRLVLKVLVLWTSEMKWSLFPKLSEDVLF